MYRSQKRGNIRRKNKIAFQSVTLEISGKMEKWIETPGNLILTPPLKQSWNYLESSMQLQWDAQNVHILDSVVIAHPRILLKLWELNVTAILKHCYIFVTQGLSNMSL